MIRLIINPGDSSATITAAGGFLDAIVEHHREALARDGGDGERAFHLVLVAVQAIQQATLKRYPGKAETVIQAIGAAVGVSYGMSGDPSQVRIAGMLLGAGLSQGHKQAEAFLTPPTDAVQ